MIGRDDAAEHRGEQRQQCDEVVAQPVPQEQDDHAAQDGKREDLVATHCAVLGDVERLGRPPRYHSHEASTRVEHRHLLDAMLGHAFGDTLCSVLLGAGEERGGHHLRHRRGGRIETGSHHTDQDVANRQHPDDALIDPDEDEPAIDIGDCPRGVLHAVLGWNERHIPQHQLGNLHSSDLSIAAEG